MTNNQNTSRVSRRNFGRLAAGSVLGLAMPPTIGRAQPATLRVMSIQATTGPSSPYGWRERDWAQLVSADINASGHPVGGSTYRIESITGRMWDDPHQA